MQTVSRLLGVLVSLLLLVGAVEGAGRLAGCSPRTTIHRFDGRLGWVKRPGAHQRYRTGEFDVSVETNSRGLRGAEVADDPAPGTTRILVVGDSFTLGTTVDLDDTIPALLARRLADEGRSVEVVNGGTEGWSTDQEVLWLAEDGRRLRPAVVVLQAYENDIFWSSQAAYLRYPKPRIASLDPEGRPQPAPEPLRDPGPGPWLPRVSGIAAILSGRLWPASAPTLPGPPVIPAEWEPRLRDGAAGWDDVGRAFRALAAVARDLGAKPLVLVVPDKAQVDPAAREAVARALGDDPAYDPGRPYRGLVERARAAGLVVVDPLAALAAAQSRSATPLYYRADWHTTPLGNRILADALADAIAAPEVLGPAPWNVVPLAARPLPAAGGGGLAGRSTPLVLAWASLSLMYGLTHRERGPLRAIVEVGGLVAAVGVLFVATTTALAALPGAIGWWVGRLIVVGFVGAILWYLRHRLPVMLELFATFVRRGHWYALPVLLVLLTIGGLLVVAASSPWLAPFIYTLF